MIFLPRWILAFFLAVNKKLAPSLDRANTARFVIIFRLLLMPLRCQLESIRWELWAQKMGSLLDFALPCRPLVTLPKERGPTEARPGRKAGTD